jgi:meso-butanediol dehydrogenase/(S,S)-butanediol dehydrogenase/diacetyl reductase
MGERAVGERQVAIVTGAASGIGRATAELFAERGFAVVVNDLTGESLGWAARRDSMTVLAGDVSDDALNAALVARALDEFGRLDVAVLNAGIVGSPALEDEGAMERLDAVLAVNVRGVASGIRHAAGAMRVRDGGAIVATASTSGLRADPGSWAYNASKAAVINLVRAAALDYANRGVRVNAVAPGPTDTGMTAGLATTPLYDDLRRRVPMQRWGQPREQAEVIWFLASPAASFVTGVTIPCDGGISANVGHFMPPGDGVDEMAVRNAARRSS